ncbi:MAG: CDGSH iron-sulfur domain-containing protein [Candidatus Moranbacteria bacterium]|nr:CDGSH iron-sulfur domain-containing protein [Candidatus Moranbacteria bacterium]
MARKVIHTAQGPAEFTTASGDIVKICRCGLTASEQGLCDDSHKQTLDEKAGDLYEYGEAGQEEGGCCGGGCCSM